MSLIKRQNCPACNKVYSLKLFSLSYHSQDMKIFLQKYYGEKILNMIPSNKNYNLLECQYCKLIYQEEIPDEKFTMKLYEEIIDQKDSLQKKEDFEKKYYKKLTYETNLIKGIFKKKNDEISILDFGAGWGFWLNHFKNQNFDVNAFEISKTRIDYMRKNKIYIIDNLEKITKKFDFIYTEETFEHIPKPKNTLMLLSELLKNDGFLLVRFPSNFLFKFKLKKTYKPKNDCAHPLEHINLFKRSSFREMVKETNLKIIDFKSIFNFSIKNVLKDFKNLLYFDSILLKKIKK